jgi:hypothetical protein
LGVYVVRGDVLSEDWGCYVVQNFILFGGSGLYAAWIIVQQFRVWGSGLYRRRRRMVKRKNASAAWWRGRKRPVVVRAD